MRSFLNLVRLSTVALSISASSCLLATETVPVQGSVLAPRFIPAVQNQVMSGAVFLVATKDKVLHLEAVGDSDLEGKTPM